MHNISRTFHYISAISWNVSSILILSCSIMKKVLPIYIKHNTHNSTKTIANIRYYIKNNLLKLNILGGFSRLLQCKIYDKQYLQLLKYYINLRIFLAEWLTVFSRITVSANKNEFSSSPIRREVATLICSLWVRSRQDASCELSSRLLLVFTTPCRSSVTIASLCRGSGKVAMSNDIFCAILFMILVVVIMSPPYSVLLSVTCKGKEWHSI